MAQVQGTCGEDGGSHDRVSLGPVAVKRRIICDPHPAARAGPYPRFLVAFRSDIPPHSHSEEMGPMVAFNGPGAAFELATISEEF